MNRADKQAIYQSAKAVLELNDVGDHTQPSPGIYTHQWLWDSAYIAIGIAQYDAQRAAKEI